MKKYIAVMITIITLISLVGCNSSVAPTSQDAEPELTFDEKCDLAYKTVLLEVFEYDMDKPFEGDTFDIKLDNDFAKELGVEISKKYTRNRYDCVPVEGSALWTHHPHIDFLEFSNEEDLRTAQEFYNQMGNPYEACIVSYPYLIYIMTRSQESCDAIENSIMNISIFNV